MELATNEAEVLERVERWANDHDLIRLVLLTSGRSRPDGAVDLLSDYDIILVTRDPASFASDAWVHGVGVPLIIVRDTEPLDGIETRHCIVLYADGTKIDYTIWPMALLERIRATDRLTDELDTGYRVLLDKDGLARGLPAPTYRAYRPVPPTEHEYWGVIEELWWCAAYVAKYLWREELMPVKVILDYEMKYLLVRRLLEWRIGLDHEWRVPVGFFGRGLRRRLAPELWADVAATYTGPGREENWAALFRTIDLFRRVAIAVGRDLSYSYPHGLDAATTA